MESLKVSEPVVQVVHKDPCEFLKDIIFNQNRFNYDYSSDWIFRGHSHSSYPIIPTIVRNINIKKIQKYMINTILKDSPRAIENRVDAIFDRLPLDYKKNRTYRNRLVNIIYLNFCESYLVEKFLSESNKAVLEVPSLKASEFNFSLIGDKLDSYIKKYLAIDDKNNAANLKTMEPVHTPLKIILHEQNAEWKGYGNFFNCLNITEHSLARHHSVPTRFLDWTTDPLVAALFATITDSRQKRKDICVWRLNRRYIDNFLRVHDRIIQKGLKFLTLQKGLFIEMSFFDDYYLFKGKWPTLEQYIQCHHKSSNGILEKIILKSEKVNDLKKILDTMGYKKHIYMPTYDNVGEYIKNQIYEITK